MRSALAERRAKGGRWIQHAVGDSSQMLRAHSAVWQVGDSKRLFEPKSVGGLGLTASRQLLWAGVRVVAHYLVRCERCVHRLL
jgi:hypothetical protein